MVPTGDAKTENPSIRITLLSSPSVVTGAPKKVRSRSAKKTRPTKATGRFLPFHR
jgi:hypothetical protein